METSKNLWGHTHTPTSHGNTQNEHAMPVNNTCTHTQHSQPHTASPGKGQEEVGNPLPPPCRQVKTCKDIHRGILGHGEFPAQHQCRPLETMRSETHSPERALEGVSGPQPGRAAL